jgi:hypothetical protein
LTIEQARELGWRLYEEIGLQGDAEWRSDTRELQAFVVARIIPFRRGGVLEAFEEVAAAAGDRWKGVDAAKFVDSLRSG